jgi:hypothetical protein
VERPSPPLSPEGEVERRWSRFRLARVRGLPRVPPLPLPFGQERIIAPFGALVRISLDACASSSDRVSGVLLPWRGQVPLEDHRDFSSWPKPRAHHDGPVRVAAPRRRLRDRVFRRRAGLTGRGGGDASDRRMQPNRLLSKTAVLRRVRLVADEPKSLCSPSYELGPPPLGGAPTPSVPTVPFGFALSAPRWNANIALVAIRRPPRPSTYQVHPLRTHLRAQVLVLGLRRIEREGSEDPPGGLPDHESEPPPSTTQ